MAASQQGRVTDYFSSKKKVGTHASKRRKVEIISTDVVAPQEVTNTHRNLKLLDSNVVEKTEIQTKQAENAFSPLQTRASRKAKSAPTNSSKKTTTRRRKGPEVSGQKLMSDILSTQKLEIPIITESITSSWDEHDGESKTPTKQTLVSESKSRKRTRGQVLQTEVTEATPEKRTQNNETSKNDKKSKKKLEMVEDKQQTTELQPCKDSIVPKCSLPTPAQKSVKMSAAVNAVLKKCKTLQKKESSIKKAEDIKEKLSKVTNLDDLKNRLSKMKETKDKLKGKVPTLTKFDNIKVETETPSDVKPKVPAYEKFHHLATSGAPTLMLPYKYKLLGDQFRGMDTVVSMLHNRNEVCTFSKLRAAVQELTKRNFEKSHVGKIKTVYPEAYQLRQEKGLKNAAGFKEPGYQLTIDAKLETNPAKKVHTVFKASHLVGRREHFHNGLIHIVKQHHTEFLSKLTVPLTIPDEKITRWHPKFPLDEVPDIVESPLPCPPDVQTYQTAKDVLNHARGKVIPKVEEALTAVANEEARNTPKIENITKPLPKPANSGTLKGIPQSLLEKIRAREAANTVCSLMRDPKEEKRTTMMRRLPDLMRIVRSQFVTEKKPSLTQESLVTKIQASYRSGLALGDIQSHIDLCVELFPEWITEIQIKKGKYYKIDRNIELSILTDKISNILKTKN